jgi:uncharacterized membrane protein
MRAWDRRLTDAQVDRLVALILQIGIVLSSATVLAGGAYYLIRHGTQMPRYEVFHGEPSDLSTVAGVISGALRFQARGIVQLGILLLIATPVARVIVAALAFALQRDLTYVGVSLIVLAVLLYSLIGGVS